MKRTAVLVCLLAGLCVTSAAQPKAPDKLNHYYFLLDTSGSMNETAPGAVLPTRIKLQQSLQDFIPKLEDKTKVSVYTFDQGIRDYWHFVIPEDTGALLKAVGGLSFKGQRTYAWESLDAIIQEAVKRTAAAPESIPILMMYTDGKDETSWTLDQVLEKFKSLHEIVTDAQLFVITLNFEIATPTGGLPSGANIIAVSPEKPVPAPFTVRFDWWPRTPQVGEDVLFIDRTMPRKTGYAYGWSFGDGSTSDLPEPQKAFSKQGTYRVVLSVQDGQREDKYEKEVTVGTSLVAEFAASRRTGRAPLKVKLKNKSTGHITDYEWDFGDGARSTEKDPLFHSFRRAGAYTISLKVRDSKTGEESVFRTDIRVSPALPWGTILPIGGLIGLSLLAAIVRRAYCNKSVPFSSVYDLDALIGPSAKDLVIGFGRRCMRRRHTLLFPDKAVSLPVRTVGTLTRSSQDWQAGISIDQGDRSSVVHVLSGHSVTLYRNGRFERLVDDHEVALDRPAVLIIDNEPFILSSTQEGQSAWRISSGWIARFISGTFARYRRGTTDLDLDRGESVVMLPEDQICFETFSLRIDFDPISGHIVLRKEDACE